MKITSGVFSGTDLKTPKNTEVRPTLSKTRQAVFNILRPYIAESVCVDIFAGTGALGFEALSNGAAMSYFIDNRHAELISSNAAKLKLGSEKAVVISAGWEKGINILSKKGVKADIIFADPPYDGGYPIKLLNSPGLSDILKDSGLFVLESSDDEAPGGVPAGLRVIKQRKYGQAVITLILKGGING